MKKYILILITILLMPISVTAGGGDDDSVSGTTNTRQTCIYRNLSLKYISKEDAKTQYNYNKFVFSGLNGAAGGPSVEIKAYYNIELGEDKVAFEEKLNGIDYIINYNKDYGIKFDIASFMSTQFYKYKENQETFQKAIDEGKFCPKTVYELTKENKRKYIFCDGYNSELEVETCGAANNYIKKEYSGWSVMKQYLFAETAITNNGQKDTSQTDVKDKYVETETKKDDACDENSDSYDLEKCKTYGEISDTLVDQAGDQGIDKKTLYEYKEAKLTPINPEPLECAGEGSLLGNATCESGQDCDPAFYIQTIFNVMKYVAIILLIVMSSLDFLGVVGSNDDGAMKKAMNKCITRLILCIVIFFMPTILEYIFTWMKVYTPSTCGIK